MRVFCLHKSRSANSPSHAPERSRQRRGLVGLRRLPLRARLRPHALQGPHQGGHPQEHPLQAGHLPSAGRRGRRLRSQLWDLVGLMLERDPRRRMGVTRGATEIKRHPFFASVDLALIRCMAPPVVPDRDAVAPAGSGDRKAAKLGSWSSMSSNCGSKKRKSSSSNFRRRSTSTCEERQGVFRMLVSWNQESWFSNKIKTTTSKER
jgi:hypothetical protein